MRKIQIGIIGSMADTKLTQKAQELAKEVGEEIAKHNAVLVFGYEGDYDSLSEIAAHSCESAGGETIAFIWDSAKKKMKNLKSTQIVTGQSRGGGREYSFILSCDAIICIGGGSGTLMEIAMAYQNNISLIALKESGGWSEKLAGQYLDERKRLKILEGNSPVEAVRLAIECAQ